MISRPLMRVESVVMAALRQAAADYRTDRGRFLPFCENRIHEAIQDYDKMSRHIPTGPRGGYKRQRKESAIDPDAIRRGLMMKGCF